MPEPIKPITKASQLGRNRLKAGKKAQKAIQKAEKKKRTEKVRGEVSPRLRAMIFERDGGKCVLCGHGAADGTTLHCHHIVPVAQEGKTREENLCTLCAECNQGAGARRLDMLRAIGHAIDPKAIEAANNQAKTEAPESAA